MLLVNRWTRYRTTGTASHRRLQRETSRVNRSNEESSGSWETGGVRIADLLAGLRHLDKFREVAFEDLEPLQTKGLNHAHIRVRNASAVLRIPRLSAYDLDPVRNLEYQQTCFTRSLPSGVTPRLIDLIEPREEVPWGALVVQEIRGQSPELPFHLDSIARALASIHSLSVPVEAARRPMISFHDPVQAALRVIDDQSSYLKEAGIGDGACRMIEEEINLARAVANSVSAAEHPVTLVGTDTHPGNFLVADERTVFVDLEKMVYGSPAVDLAHASVYTSTMWDKDIATALSDDQVAEFYATYFDQVPPGLGEGLRPWCAPMRRLTWLRTTTWCAKWRVQARNAVWSPLLGNPEYMASVGRRFDDYFNPATIERVRTSLAAEIPC